VLAGSIAEPTREPLNDDANAARAREGAIFARDHFGSSLGVGVQPAGTPGSDNFTQVTVALAHADGVHEWTRGYDLNIEDNWQFVGTTALDGIRTYLTNE
jgi:hypothetical protein